MQPTRTLADVIASLNSVYQPQQDLIRGQQAALPGQAQAQSDALGAKKDQAFGDILAGARRRGLGFSGIPLGDQAKYLATDYAPALANLQTANTERATSLEQAILQIQQQQNTQGQGIYQTEQDRAEQARQFDAQQRASAAQNASFANLFNQPPTPAPATTTADPYQKINKSNAINEIHGLLNLGDVGILRKTIDAITKSANNGNLYDKYKLELLQAAQEGNSNAAYNPAYANLLKAAANYKAAAKKTTPVANRANVTGTGQVFNPNILGIR